MKFIRKIFQKNKCKVSQILPDVNEKQNVFTDEDKAEYRELVRQWERGKQI